MSQSFRQILNYDGNGLELMVTVDNAGWSTSLKPVLSFSTSEHRRGASCPDHINLLRGVRLTENIGPLEAVSGPTFDPGLGCFGCAAKIVDKVHGELDRLWPAADARELEAARKVLEEDMHWCHDEWLRFQVHIALREAGIRVGSNVLKSLLRYPRINGTVRSRQILQLRADLEAPQPDPGEC
ncbi:hypothetical protein F5Y17DRAFT_442012 [Xylariaceae sp. FL0594]|nr:hypothetical protein F5Y17DRAFT_442012 [Xylariaceae sp. FL0594]